MDFDKQYGNLNSASMINRGRGFNEKPMAAPTTAIRQTRSRNPHRKVDMNTQFVVVNSKKENYPPQHSTKWRRNQNTSYNRGGIQRRGSDRRDRRGGKPSFPTQSRRDNKRSHLTPEQMDEELNRYYQKDETIMAQKLDADLAMYTQQRDAVSQPIDSVPQTSNSLQ